MGIDAEGDRGGKQELKHLARNVCAELGVCELAVLAAVLNSSQLRPDKYCIPEMALVGMLQLPVHEPLSKKHFSDFLKVAPC